MMSFVEMLEEDNRDGDTVLLYKLDSLKMKTGLGIPVIFAQYEDIQAHPDYDGDGLLNGEEYIIRERPNGTAYIEIRSLPMKADSDLDGINDFINYKPMSFDIRIESEDDKKIVFNTGREWIKFQYSIIDYIDSIASIVGNGRESFPIRRKELNEISINVRKNLEQNFQIDELTIICILNYEGSIFYLDKDSKETRDEIFMRLHGRETQYYQHNSKGELVIVPADTKDGFFTGYVISEADINFSFKLYSKYDVYTV